MLNLIIVSVFAWRSWSPSIWSPALEFYLHNEYSDNTTAKMVYTYLAGTKAEKGSPPNDNHDILKAQDAILMDPSNHSVEDMHPCHTDPQHP